MAKTYQQILEEEKKKFGWISICEDRDCEYATIVFPHCHEFEQEVVKQLRAPYYEHFQYWEKYNDDDTPIEGKCQGIYRLECEYYGPVWGGDIFALRRHFTCDTCGEKHCEDAVFPEDIPEYYLDDVSPG